MDIGTLNRRVTVQAPSSGLDQDGQPEGWKTFAKLWADIRYVSGLESVRSDSEVSLRKASVRVRWRDGLDASMRVVDSRGTTYRIVGVLPDMADRQYMDLVCEIANG